MSRKKFNKEFKVNAVKMVLKENYKTAHAARVLNIHPQTLYRWVAEYKEFGDDAFPGQGNNKYHEHYKMRVLEKENKSLKEELEILKKYQAFLKQAKNKI